MSTQFNSLELIISLGYCPGRTSDHKMMDLMNRKDLGVWEKANELIKNIPYEHNGDIYTVESNFIPVIEYYKDINCIHTQLEEGFIKKDENMINRALEKYNLYKNVNYTIRVKYPSKLNDKENFSFLIAQKYVYDVFLLLNLSVPGSCNFKNLKLTGESDLKLTGLETFRSADIHLMSDYFECGYSNFLDKKNICIKELPLDLVIEWFNNLNIWIKQRAEKENDKAIFAILNLCRLDMDITSIVWVFYGLEALYKTRNGQNQSDLINRINSLLELNSKAKKLVSSTISELYKYRSSFVHGGYKAIHPVANDIVDNQVWDEQDKLLKNTDIGFQLLAASIQELIRKQWSDITFEEKISGY